MIKDIIYRFSGVLEFIPLKILMRMTGQKAVVPVYHLVSDDEVAHIRHLYAIKAVQQFKEDLDFLMKEFRILSVEDLKTDGEWGRIRDKGGFLLTFDDGLREFYDIIAPLLVQRGIPAICFLNSAFIDNKDIFYRYKASILMECIQKKMPSPATEKSIIDFTRHYHLKYTDTGTYLLSLTYKDRDKLDEFAGIVEVDFREYLDKFKPYMTSSQLNSLQKQDFIFGAHSIDHPLFSELTLEQQLFQIRQSITDVSNMVHGEYRLFSFPFTDEGISADLFDNLYGNDLPFADLSFGCAGLKRDITRRNIQRIPLEAGEHSADRIIYGEYFYFLLKSLFNKNKILRSYGHQNI